MKTRIFSIMDMRKKKAGAAVLCSVLLLTFGTGVAYAENVHTQASSENSGEAVVTPWIAAQFAPSPETYAPYAAFGITVSKDGSKLLYNGQPVRQFVDEKADGWAFYLDEAGSLNVSVVYNAAGEMTGVENVTAQKAQEYYEAFFAEELDPDYAAKMEQEVIRDLAEDTVWEDISEGESKFEKYQPFGITYSAADEALYFNGQRVKFFIDRVAEEAPDMLWTDAGGTLNLAAVRDASGQITGLESI